VRKNMKVVNKQRKKQGSGQIVFNAEKVDRLVGRNYIAPILLLLFIGLYVVATLGNNEFTGGTMYWITIACYLVLAAIFFFRKPYIAIGKDYVQTRRMTGDKRLSADAIKSITVQKGYVAIEPQKGAHWMFSRLLNRYPTDEIAEKLKAFAHTNHITFNQK
jgi:hypothetical protein